MAVANRLFVVDPMCVLNYGHNPKSLVYFSDYFRGRGFECFPVACRYFKSKDPAYSDFVPHFGYYYHDTIALPNGVAVSEDAPLYVSALRDASQDLARAVLSNDRVVNQALIDWHILFKSFDISQRDFIFFPSADYYGVLGLLLYLHHMPSNRRPEVHLRFIGVMEHARKGGGDALPAIGAALRDVRARVTVSAEAPAYAAHLARRLRVDVASTLYPPYDESLAYDREAAPFIAFSAGAGREDKGFLRLLNIARTYALSYPSDDVRFVVQNLRPGDERRHADYMSQLYAAPNVELIAAIQSDEAMLANYRRCDISIMPYDAEVYRMRGSAVFMESIMYGRAFAISGKTGFDPLMPQFVSGAVATSDRDFCEAINATYRMDRALREQLCHQTREAYKTYAYAALGKIFQ